MNINRNNYEEFFLLYADNELSPAEKQFVESFVQENPDLQQELGLLQQAKLVADSSIVFENKELLTKSFEDNNSLINHSNYEEFFLLYVDDELNEENKKSVEEFAARHLPLQQELALLQKTRLEPDRSIVYERKEKLYREDHTKLRLFPWLRIAAAAILLLSTGLFIFKFSSTTTEHSVVSSGNKNDGGSKNTGIAKKDPAPVTSTPSAALKNRNSTQEEMALLKKREEKKLAAITRTEQKRKISGNNREIKEDGTYQKIASVKQKNNMSPIISEGVRNDQNTQVNTGKITIRPDAVVATADFNIKDASAKNTITQPVNTNPVSKQVSFVEQDQGSNPEDQTNFTAFSQKKNKMRGFFRKVSRFFEKTTNVGDNKSSVLIGNFQIALK